MRRWPSLGSVQYDLLRLYLLKRQVRWHLGQVDTHPFWESRPPYPARGLVIRAFFRITSVVSPRYKEVQCPETLSNSGSRLILGGSGSPSSIISALRRKDLERERGAPSTRELLPRMPLMHANSSAELASLTGSPTPDSSDAAWWPRPVFSH